MPAFRVDPRSILVTVACLLGSAGSAYLLYLDFNETGGSGQGAPMAQVERRVSKVRRKPPTSFIWSNVRSDEQLYKKEYVQTGPDSSAVIRLKDGSSLELKENSLVVIDDASNLALGFVRGGGVLRTKEGDSKITASEKKGEAAKIEKLPVQLVAPAPLAEFASDSSTHLVRFAWKIFGAKPTDLALEISPNERFSASSKRTIPASAVGAEVPLRPGEYYWRLARGTEPLSDPVQFQILAVPKAKPIFPAQGQRLQSWGEDGTIQFRWMPGETKVAAEEIKASIEVSSDPQFKQIVRTEEVLFGSGSSYIHKLSPGSFWWRIRTHFRQLDSASSPEAFTFSRQDQLAIQPLSPGDGFATPIGGQISFSWSAEGANSEISYQLELTDDSGRPVMTTAPALIPRYTWSQPKEGSLKWKAKALWKGKVIGESPWRGISLFPDGALVLKSPAKAEKIFYWDRAPELKFEWERDPIASRDGFEYEVSLSPRPDFSIGVVSAKTKNTKFTDLKPNSALSPGGQYYWKVRLLNSKGVAVKSSDPSPFIYSTYPLPAAPTTAQLDEGIFTFNPLQREKPPKMNWVAVAEVKDYEVSLFQLLPEGKKLMLQKTVETNQLQLGELPEGKYEWTIRSIDRLKRKGEPMLSRSFSVTLGDPLPAPHPSSAVFQ